MLLLLVFVIASGLWLVTKWLGKLSPPVPPGSLGFPLIGETLHFYRAIISNKPWEFFETREKRYGPVFKTSLFGHPTVVVKPEGLKLIFSNHNKLVISAWPSPMKQLVGDNSLFFMDEGKAKSFRKILMAFLGQEAMQRYVERTNKIIEKQVESFWGRNDEVAAYPLFKQALFSLVFDVFLSVEDSDSLREELLEPFVELLRGLVAVPVDFPGTHYHKAKIARKKIMHAFDGLIKQRRIQLTTEEHPHHDLMSVLLTTKTEDGELLPDDTIKDNIITLVLAGHDTSASSLTVAIKCIAENPSCYEELRKEHYNILASKPEGEPLDWKDIRNMKYTWAVIPEGIRIIPPASGVLRKVIKDFEMDGFTVPKGWQLMLSAYRSNMNAKFFENPNKFDPNRYLDGRSMPNSFAPFGGGPRICPGYELVKLQDHVFLHHLITRFKWSLVDPNEEIIMTPLAQPVKGLLLKLVSNPLAITRNL